MKLTQEQKDTIEVVGSAILTAGTAGMIELLVGGGSVIVINTLFGSTMTKAQLRLFEAVVFTGSVGVGLLTAYNAEPKFSDMMREALSIIPTKETEEKDG